MHLIKSDPHFLLIIFSNIIIKYFFSTCFSLAVDFIFTIILFSFQLFGEIIRIFFTQFWKIIWIKISWNEKKKKFLFFRFLWLHFSHWYHNFYSMVYNSLGMKNDAWVPYFSNLISSVQFCWVIYVKEIFTF